jgi:outer membrane protein assembly factor BamB
VLVTLGGRLIVVDPKDGKVLSRTPENSILGQAAGGVRAGTDIIAMTCVRGGEKTPNVGMHLYRLDPAFGAVKWHAYNGAIIDTRQVMANVVGERINGPFNLDKAKGILLATSDKGVRLYNLDDGKERWFADQDLPNSYRVMSFFGNNSFAVIRSMMQNRIYVPTNPPPVEGDGVVYVASSDEVFAIDATSGKINWTSKSKSLSLVAGLSLSGNTIMVRQGMYADANDYGAPTTVVTQFAGPTWVEEAEVYIEEDPYGYVGLDAATGKETWNALDFEPHDIAMSGPMPMDIVVREASKAKKEKGCRLGKLGVGGIVTSYRTKEGVIYVGKGGVAGAPADSCAATWSVDGSIKKMEKVFEITEQSEAKSFGMVQHDNPAYLITHYGNEASVVDLAAGKVILSVGKAEAVKVDWANKRLFVADGNDLAMYVLP